MRDRQFYRGDYKQFQEQQHRNRVFFGIALAVVGLVLMLTTMHILPCLGFESWPAILIVIGLLIGIKSGFRSNAWWILLIVGIANFTPAFQIFGHPSRDFALPAIVIIVGIAIALKPRRYYFSRQHMMSSTINSESTVNIDITFGGKKEVITSKDFKGGTVSVTFAGCEINLAQADFTEPSVVLDCRVSFGGIEMIIPSHWHVQNEISPSFGNVEDDRTIQTGNSGEPRKLLILRGSCSFGNIEIKSY